MSPRGVTISYVRPFNFECFSLDFFGKICYNKKDKKAKTERRASPTRERIDLMRKNVKLSNKKAAKAPEKEPFYFFVKDQGEGAARVIVIVLKIVELILTSIFALCLGVFGSIIMMLEIQTAAMYMWLISSAVYVIGTFVVMLGHSKIALCIHGAAAVGTVVTYYLFQVMFSQIPENNGPSVLYMPCIFITIITFVIMLLINLPKWLEKQAAKAREIAPSILSKDEEE